MSGLAYLPLVLAVAAVGLLVVAPSIPALDRELTRRSIRWFGDVAERWGRRRDERTELLQATHATTTYTVFRARTWLFSIVGGVAAAILGAYAAFGLISFLIAHKAAVQAALPRQLHFVVETETSIDPLGGLGGGGGGGGLGIPLGGADWLVGLLPWQLVRAASWLWSSIPPSWRPTRSGGGGDSGVATGDVSIRIVFPDLGVVPDGLFALSGAQILLLLVGAVVVGALGAAAVHAVRWHNLRSRADERALLVDESFVRTIAFVYALSRSGMLFPEIMRTVSRNREAFGEAAEELAVSVKLMDLFSADVITALERTARWTPSDDFGEFLKNLTNVLKSGQNVPSYLHDRYQQAQQERVEHQEQLLEYFTALGEAYVAVLVAGPLFMITILTIFGLINGGMYRVLQFLVFLGLPLANLAFIGYLGNFGRALTTTQIPSVGADAASTFHYDGPTADDDPSVVADGGVAVEENLRRLRVYERLRPVRWALEYPVETATARPSVVLVLVVPLAVLTVAGRLLAAGGTVPAGTLDDWLVQALLVVLVPYALVREVHTRRVRRIEAEVPDFLESLASANEAGRTFTESLRRLGEADLGVLDESYRRLLADIEWGARTETALHRFGDRIGSATVSRVVALLTNALRASDQIGPVIRIAAEEARKDRSLQRRRRQELLMYVVIIYLAFVVFIGLSLALRTILVPAVPTAEQLGGGGGVFGVSVAIDPAAVSMKEKYMELLFHASAVQALASGFVAGKMGEGSARSGAKHAAILLAAAYLLFTVFG